MMNNYKDLKWVKLLKPELIPEELIKEVRRRTFEPEDFYEIQHLNVDNPSNLLYVIVDKEKVIKGFIWAQMNAIDESLFVNTYSIDKEYWFDGHAIDFAVAFLKELKDKIKAKRVFWLSTNPKYFMKKGFKPSKNVLMEYVEDKGE